jgi:hypothetical protein
LISDGNPDHRSGKVGNKRNGGIDFDRGFESLPRFQKDEDFALKLSSSLKSNLAIHGQGPMRAHRMNLAGGRDEHHTPDIELMGHELPWFTKSLNTCRRSGVR